MAIAGFFACATAWAGPWATGPKLQKILAEPIDILWSGNPLRQAVESLAHTRDVAVLIDRRVDPERKLDLQLKGVTLDSALRQIADSRGLGVSRLGDVLFLGPPEAAERLPRLAAAMESTIRHLPPASRRKWLQRKAFRWDDLDAPRDIVKRLGEESGIRIEGLDRIPHDLWAGADLPPAPLLDRLLLVVIQFDQTITIAPDGSSAEIVPAPSVPLNQAEDAPRRIQSSPAAPADRLKERPPTAAPFMIHRLAIREKPLGPVLKELAKQLDLELRMDEEAIRAAGISLDQRVSITVENVGVDALFRQLLQSTGLTFHRDRQVVEIVPNP